MPLFADKTVRFHDLSSAKDRCVSILHSPKWKNEAIVALIRNGNVNDPRQNLAALGRLFQGREHTFVPACHCSTITLYVCSNRRHCA